MKKLGIVASCLVVVLCHAYQSNAAWVTKGVDTPRPYFEGIDQRAIAVASDGTVHVAYGGDHIYHAYNDGSTWHYETVDASPGLDVYPSLALDSSGKVHISYIEYSNALVKYATNASGLWVTETVVNNVSGRDHAIALDANDEVYIIFRDAADLLYKYATNSPGYWSIEETNIRYGSDVSLAIDVSGKVHISYRAGEFYDELKYTTNASGSWTTATVDAIFNGLNSHSIAVDSNGKAHVGYTDYFGLSYATNATGAWVRDRVVGVVDMAGNAIISDASIALDTTGKAHISYSECELSTSLKYATNASGSWVTEAVDNNGGNNHFTTSIALDASGSVHISYCDGRYSGNLKHAWCDMDCGNTGSWQNEVIDRAHDVGMYAALALDSGDKTHMSYYDAIDFDLKYTTNASGSWATETVDGAGWTGLHTSIKLDANDKVHISYFAVYLKYATNASGSWVAETVSDGSIERYNSIALDSSGKVHISYIDDTDALKYATNALGSWLTETVDSSAYIFSTTAIAVDSLGNAHISYYDYTNRDIRYATNTSGIWVMETIDSNGDVGWYSSLALDSKDGVHISYCDYTNNSLKYATNASGSWITETIGTVGGWYTSLILDAHDKAHISYYDGTNDDLKYVTNASGGWVTETIDSVGDVGEYSSIDLDSSGNVYVGYYDASNHDLKYAHQCLATDADCDDILAADDNCPVHYNPDQSDSYPPHGNGIGDVCDCEGNFNCFLDQDVDGSDAATIKSHFGRSTLLRPCIAEDPCNGDFNCDGDVDGPDASLFKSDFGRSLSQNPCPACDNGGWCFPCLPDANESQCTYDYECCNGCCCTLHFSGHCEIAESCVGWGGGCGAY